MRPLLSNQVKLSLIRKAQGLSRRLPYRWGRRLRELGKFALNYRGARASRFRGILFARLGRRSELLLAPFGSGKLLISTADQEVGRVVFIRGEYERVHLEAALDYLKTAKDFNPAGKLFVDVGANIGTATVEALLHFGFARAICFEPDSRNFKLLRMNVMLNELYGRADLHRIALSNEERLASLALSAENHGDSRLDINSASITGMQAAAGTEVVECMRLDSLIDGGSVPVDGIGLLWVDAQGHDSFVLEGASLATKAGVPVVVEYWPAALSRNDSLGRLEEVIRGNYGWVVDLSMLSHGLESDAVLDAGKVERLRDLYRDDDHTDLLLIR